MSVTFVKRSTLPQPVRGKEGTLSIGINVGGQMILSKKASEFMNGAKTCVVGFENGKFFIFKPTAKLVKGVAANDHIHLNHGKKGGTSFAASAILRDAGTFGGHLYDFKESGNQSFPCEINAKEECL